MACAGTLLLLAALPALVRMPAAATRQRTAPKALSDWLRECGSREAALRTAYTRSGLRMTAIAAELGPSVARVSQLIARAQADRRQDTSGA